MSTRKKDYFILLTMPWILLEWDCWLTIKQRHRMKIKSLAANQTELQIGNSTVFFSYETPVAACVNGEFYRTSEHYSVTTSKHINKWLDGRNAKSMPPSFFQNLTTEQP
jgi:hypothetical protein